MHVCTLLSSTVFLKGHPVTPLLMVTAVTSSIFSSCSAWAERTNWKQMCPDLLTAYTQAWGPDTQLKCSPHVTNAGSAFHDGPHSWCSCWSQSPRLAFDKGQASCEGTVCQRVATLLHQDLPCKPKPHKKKIWHVILTLSSFLRIKGREVGSAMSTLRTWKGTTWSVSRQCICCLLTMTHWQVPAVPSWFDSTVSDHLLETSVLFTFVTLLNLFPLLFLDYPENSFLLLLIPTSSFSTVSLGVFLHFYFLESTSFVL